MSDAMHTSTAHTAMVPGQKKRSVLFRIRAWSIRWKIRMAFLLSTLAAGCIIVFIVYVFQRKVVIGETYDKLLLLQHAKAKHAEDHFKSLEDQIRMFSADRQTVDAFSMLSESFLNIENDNFGTPEAAGLNEMNTLLEGFYTTDILPLIEKDEERKTDLQILLPADNRQRILQYLYLAGNSQSLVLKGNMNKADDESAYSILHAEYHPKIFRFAQLAGITDILLIDCKSGYVTYSIRKNIDFATNLFEGPYHHSALALAFKSAVAQAEQGTVAYIDASQYLPALFAPLMFIGSPVYNGGQLTGVVVFAFDTQHLDKLLELEKNGLSTTGSLKTIIVGEDYLYRNNDPEFVSDPAGYLRKLGRNSYRGGTVAVAERLSSTATVLKVHPQAFPGLLNRKTGITSYRSETGENVLCAYGPIKIDNLNWTLLTQIRKAEALSEITRATFFIVIIALVITGILFYVVILFSNVIAERLIELRNNLLLLLEGQKVQKHTGKAEDEIARSEEALVTLSGRITEGSRFIAEMGKGNIDMDFSVAGEEDQFGLALNSLKKDLVLNKEEMEKRKQEDEIRSWTTHGIALFNDILRSDNDNLGKLSTNIIRNIIEYLSANQGGLFLIEEEDDSRYLNLVAAYAYDRQKFHNKRINIGEGLAGNCVLEQKTVLLNRIPDNYMEISSGLGGAKPKCLMIVPLKKDDEILGVLELASFNDFRPHEVEFTERVAESIAAALITVKLHLQTSKYLERFQQQAEEMKAQDEELRQNIEELQATHEQMERLKKEENERNEQMINEIQEKQKALEAEKALLDALLDNVPENIYFKDKDSRFIRFSKSMLDLFGLKHPEELLGKSDFDFFDDEHARPAYEDEQKIISTGKAIIDLEEKEVMEDGRVSWVNTTKMPLKNSSGEIVGTFGISKSISRIKNMELEARELTKTIEGNRKLLIDILNKVPAKIFLKDENGVFVVVNDAVASVYHKTAEQIIGTSDYDNHPDEDVDSWRAQELEIVNSGEKTYLHLEKMKGKSRYLNTTKMPFVLATTDQTGLLGIQFDVTDMKMMEEQVHLLKAELEKLKR